MVQRPLYGVLVIGELPHETDPRPTAARQTSSAPVSSESRLRGVWNRWVRKLHSSSERSG